MFKQVGQIPASYSQGSGTIVSGTAANKATEAALAAYPGAIVDRVVKLSNGEYEVHYIGKHSPHVLRVICGSGSAALYGEIACAGGCQGVPSMRSHRSAKAFLPCLRTVSM